MSYNVVLRGKPETKQPGVCTFTSFDSEEQFHEAMSDLLKHSDIVAVEIDDQEATAICASVPAERLFNSALLQCVHKDGSFSAEMFLHEMKQIQFLRGEKCPTHILTLAEKYIEKAPKVF